MNCSNIPIIINNFNRLTTTRNMVSVLENIGCNNIHIIDNGSTYSPLLDWYVTDYKHILYSTYNHGNLALWNTGYNSRFNGPIIYTDSDMVIPDTMPYHFVDKMYTTLQKYSEYPKVGLAFDIEDIPNHFPYKEYIQAHERGHWQTEIEKDIYIAPVDTTFAMFDAGATFDYKALRIGGEYTIKHAPYYLDFDNLDEEELFYINSATPISTHSRMYKQNKCT